MTSLPSDGNSSSDSFEYICEEIAFHKTMDRSHRPDPNCMSKQLEITDNMRKIVVDWLVEVHNTCKPEKFVPYVLHLAVAIMDRFLSHKPIVRQKYQLVALVSFIIAAKYELKCCLSAKNAVSITDHAYTEDEVVKMETVILRTLDYSFRMVTASTFLPFILKLFFRENRSREMGCMSLYMLDLSLMDTSMYELEPSRVASAAMYMARRLYGRS